MRGPIILSNVTPELRDRLHSSSSIFVFAGAGLSAASGVPPFRGPKQMQYFEGYPPIYICSTEFIERSPDIFWRFFKHLYGLVKQAEPNLAHRTLAAWQIEMKHRQGFLSVLTTNYDGLLSQAGCSEVHELHGNIHFVICRSCKQTLPMSDVQLETLPPHCSCGGLLQPDIVLLYDYVKEDAYDAGFTARGKCDVFVVIGASGVQSHSMSFTNLVAMRQNVLKIEINLIPSIITPSMDIVLRGPAEEILPQFQYGKLDPSTESKLRQSPFPGAVSK